MFRRGSGAYSKSHRPTISGNRPNSRTAWSYARVNKFLKKKAGQKVKAAYAQDDDLLAKGREILADGGLLTSNTLTKISSNTNYRRTFKLILQDSIGNEIGTFIYALDPEDFTPHHSVEIKEKFRGRGFGKEILLKAIYVAKDKMGAFYHDSDMTQDQAYVYNTLLDKGLIKKYLNNVQLTQEGIKYLSDWIEKYEQEYSSSDDFDDLMAKGGKTFNDKELLSKHKRGESIGFTATAHLKAKGLIPRADGTKRKSEKYLEDGGTIKDYLKNVIKKTTSEGEKYYADFGRDGKIVWSDWTSDANTIYIDRIDRHANQEWVGKYRYSETSEGKKDAKGEGSYAIASLFMRYPDIEFITYNDASENQDGTSFWYRIGGDSSYLFKENFFDYFNSKYSQFNDGGVVFVRNKAYDNSQTIRRLPYRGVSAFAIHTDDFEKFKQYAEKQEGVDPSNWQVYNLDDFQDYEVCAMEMDETNDCVMGFSDEKPTLKPFNPDEHSMFIDENGQLDYDDAHEVIILPKKMVDGGMTALFVDSLMTSAKEVDAIIEYALENEINPKNMTLDEFNEKVNPEGKYSKFEVRLAKRDLSKYYKDGGNVEATNMEITCKKCGWSWNTADSQPQDATMCHKCGTNNVSEDIIQMNSPTYLRSLEFAREDAKEDVDLHKVTENAVALSKDKPIRMSEYEELVKLENGGFAYEPKEYDIQDFVCMEQDLVDSLKGSDMTKIGKIRICQAKIDLAENKLKETESEQEYEAWYMSSCIWRDCMKDLRSNNFKSGGRISGCGCKEYKDGGLAYGNSHAKGGMPMTVKNTGQNIEIEGGEGVVNKRSMQMTKQVEFQGKKMTPCEVISSINEMGGGVKFKCNDVKKIIDRDGEYD